MRLLDGARLSETCSCSVYPGRLPKAPRPIAQQRGYDEEHETCDGEIGAPRGQRGADSQDRAKCNNPADEIPEPNGPLEGGVVARHEGVSGASV